MARGGGFRSLVIGVDGSSASRRAVSFVGRLQPRSGGRATVVCVVEPVHPPSIRLLPGPIRARLGGQAAALEAALARLARRHVETAVTRLEKSGWRARGELSSGAPLDGLLRAVRTARADLLVLGAGEAGRVARFLLGSVADAATRRSPVAVLIVK
ncbi:MAG TPA: universal stress protein [Methylomirabilota bacterium]|nr:universal stress protein [Methylomirabilota bacterium]